MIEDTATWHVAKKRCEEMGGHLATIETPEEEAFVLSLMDTIPVPFWLGATDEESEGDWRWIDGAVVKLSHPVLDNDRNAEHCLYASKNAGGFSDVLSGLRFAYLVEFNR
jgi:hypothetical protein